MDSTLRVKLIARLAEIENERRDCASRMSPFYAAARLLDRSFEELELLPAFRSIWLRDRELEREATTLRLDILLAA